MNEGTDYTLHSAGRWMCTDPCTFNTEVKEVYSIVLSLEHCWNPLRALRVTTTRDCVLVVGSSSPTGPDPTRPFIPSAALNIINDHLQGDRDILMCQDELIEAGLIDWARL